LHKEDDIGAIAIKEVIRKSGDFLMAALAMKNQTLLTINIFNQGRIKRKAIMKTIYLKSSILLATVVLFFVTVGCGLTRPQVRVGKLQTTSESIEQGDADLVDVEIFMAAGQLHVSGGANDLLEADFTYNVAELEPEVKFIGGTLIINTPDVDIRAGSWWDLDDYHYDWDLYFNDYVPMEMSINMGAGPADLELDSLSLTRLSVDTGAGEVTLDLSDSSSLTRLDVEAGVGQVTVDLTGTWQDDLDANISSGVGELTLRLPRNTCVRVDVEGGLGNVNTHGMTKDGNDYVNDSCGEADVTLRIDISAGVGAINLEVSD
jgi:hypothetical protein